MVLEHRFGGPPALAHERRHHADALTQRQPGAEMTHHEHGARSRIRKVGLAEVALQRRLVAEPLGLLVGVHVAPHPCHERAEENCIAIVLPQLDPLSES